MPQPLPQHKAFMLSDFGIRLRKMVSSQDGEAPMTYAHQDDYYVIGLVEKGTGCGIIDFNEICVSHGDVFIIRPGQVHRFVSSKEIEGWLLFADSSFIGHGEKCIFDKFLLYAATPSLKIEGERLDELRQIISMLANRINRITDELVKATVRKLAETYIGIVAESVREAGLQQERHSRRHIEIVLSFIHLLAERLAVNRSPSYYASLLHISPVYLNEVVKEVTGMSATLYIRNELILQAKRLLVYTGLAVKEVSDRLGIDDYAYFTRIFTQTTGISPTTFRQKNLE